MTLLDGGRKLGLLEYLRGCDRGRVDVWVEVGRRALRARLVAVRRSEEAAARRKQRYRRRKQGKGKSASQAMLASCERDVTLTNVPQEKVTPDEEASLWLIR